MEPTLVSADLPYVLAPAASAVILLIASRAPRRAFWPLMLVGTTALITTGYRHAGGLPSANSAGLWTGLVAALPPLATAINVRSTERYMEQGAPRAAILAARWVIATVCFAVVLVALREVMSVMQGQG